MKEANKENSMNTLTRNETIHAIRSKLLEMVDDDHSMCRVASEKGIYCRGERRFTEEELKQRYSWLLRRKPAMSREELEDLANRWQLARQIVDKVPLSCDAQTMEHDTCKGWDTFDEVTLARFYHELVGGDIAVKG
jgi:hypothetical protein